MLATVAPQQAQGTAKNLRKNGDGESPEPFQYKDPGWLATIGRNAAVARIWGLSFSGFIAWMIWVVLHIYRLIGFRNRLVVLINWAWDYLFYERAVRIILPGPRPEAEVRAGEAPARDRKRKAQGGRG